MKCPYCEGECDIYGLLPTFDYIDGFLMVSTSVIALDRPTCQTCGAQPLGPEAMINPDLTSEELVTGWYRGSYTLEETFR